MYFYARALYFAVNFLLYNKYQTRLARWIFEKVAPTAHGYITWLPVCCQQLTSLRPTIDCSTEVWFSCTNCHDLSTMDQPYQANGCYVPNIVILLIMQAYNVWWYHVHVLWCGASFTCITYIVHLDIVITEQNLSNFRVRMRTKMLSSAS